MKKKSTIKTKNTIKVNNYPVKLIDMEGKPRTLVFTIEVVGKPQAKPPIKPHIRKLVPKRTITYPEIGKIVDGSRLFQLVDFYANQDLRKLEISTWEELAIEIASQVVDLNGYHYYTKNEFLGIIQREFEKVIVDMKVLPNTSSAGGALSFVVVVDLSEEGGGK